MPEIALLSLPDLLIDTENPRLPQPNVGQREALRAFASHEPGKLIALAKDIVGYGLNPTELSIVMPFNDDLRRYVVLEGNRRLTALKALENPEWLVGAMPPSSVDEMRNLARQYQENPVESLQCIVMADREEARHWMELRHTGGQNNGAAVVPWGSDDAARFRARTGNFEFHTQALNLLEDAGQLTPAERRKVKATSLKRLLGTPEVRAKLGIESRDGKLAMTGDEKRVIKALKHVVNDLETLKVKDIYTQDKRIAYAEGLPPNIVVPPLGRGSTILVAGKQFVVTRKLGITSVAPRDKLIPSRFALNITEPRLQDIARELKKLSLSQHPNAISVLFRVFVELSVDTYITTKKLGAITVSDVLHKKINSVCDDLVSRQKLTAQQAKPVRRAAAKDSFLAPSINMMHGYVHCPYIFPAPGDLRAHWDGLQSFVLAVWAP
jgi:hypothetical protein